MSLNDISKDERRRAAIALRVPNSGCAGLDAMIRQANRHDAVVAAMQGLIPTYKGNGSFDDAGAEHLANQCVLLADALLARLEEKP